MDPTLAGLLQGCAESPLDSTPHLILSDWLDDHGQTERAELIRLQCRLAAWIPEVNERQAVTDRANLLIAQNREAWLGPLAPLAERVEFTRGLARLWFTSRTFCSVAFGPAFASQRSSALIEQVRLLNCRSLNRVVTRPWLADLPALSLLGLDLPPGQVGLLFASPTTRGLVALDLSGNALSSEEAGQLCESPLFGQLAQLELRNARLPERSLVRLLEEAGPRLKNLDLIGNTDSRPTLERLGQRENPGRRMNSLGMEFVPVPAGSFLMGSAHNERGAQNDQYPRHEVTLTRPFWMGRCAVTQSQFQAVMNSNPSRHLTGGAHYPAENIDYHAAQEFCDRLSRLPAERLARRTYRMPTEAEWEHACRAGSFTTFFWGDDASPALMNYRGRFDSTETEQPHPGRPMPVGSYQANAFGIHEMHGNIWEWTTDWYGQEYYAQAPSPCVDPTGPTRSDADDPTRTIRGGCWHAVGICCRSAHRFGEELHTQDDYTGFRVVLVPG